MNKLFVVSTWHGGAQEHSWEWSRESLSKTYLAPLLDPKGLELRFAKREDAHNIFRECLRILTTEPETLLIFNSDLTHYGLNYGHSDGSRELLRKEEREGPLLDSLCEGKPLQTKQMGRELPCGIVALEILSRLTQKLGYVGHVVDYYDSSRVSGDASSWVSYVSMGFHPRNQCEQRASFLDRFAEYRQKRNPIFLGFKSLVDGRTYASIGQLGQETIEAKIISIIPSLRRDLRSGRLGGSDVDLCKTFIYINILEKDWETIYNDENFMDYLAELNNHDKPLGVQCIWEGGSSIFIPSVWRENPEWTIWDILEHLSVKAGYQKDFWQRCDQVRVFGEVGIFT